MTLTFEAVTVVFYWFFLYDPLDYPTDWLIFRNHINHSFPFALLAIDFIISTIPFNYNHIGHFLFIMAFYGFGVNLPVTLATGEPVYSVLTWEGFGSVLYVLVLLLLFLMSYFGFYFISVKKNRAYLAHRQKATHVLVDEEAPYHQIN